MTVGKLGEYETVTMMAVCAKKKKQKKKRGNLSCLMAVCDGCLCKIELIATERKGVTHFLYFLILIHL